MYRIRFHGRGGQGVKTAGRILGTALFREGLEVQDAPRYGAERRGAPIFAYVRAGREAIRERGVIREPDLVVVLDDTLMLLPPAGVLEGVAAHTMFLVETALPAAQWKERLSLPGKVLTLHADNGAAPGAGLPLRAVAGAGAAARLLGIVSRETLHQALRDELGALDAEKLAENIACALDAYDAMGEYQETVKEGVLKAVADYDPPQWINLSAQPALLSSPTIYASGTSRLSQTGLWRTERPLIDPALCRHCWWVCGTYCPDNAIVAHGAAPPLIDYDHCKGCLICLAQCPSHAISAVPEAAAAGAKGGVA